MSDCLFQKTLLCFRYQVFYVRNIPIHSCSINTITIIITTITIIIIINSKTTITFNIISIITIIINFAMIIIIIIIPSFIFNFFDIRSSCVPLIYEFIYEFICLTTFLIFIGYRFNNLLKNIFMEILLLTLVSFKLFQYFQ